MTGRKKTSKPDFRVADGWPLGPPDTKAEAVRALVANHTLIVGQSPSGKTHAARRLVEEILSWTDTRIVILDPNADFRWLYELNPQPSSDEPPREFSARWRKIRPRMAVATEQDGTAWGINWNNLSLEEMAAFLQLTPAETFAEYRHLLRHFRYFRLKEMKPESTLIDFMKSYYLKMAVGEELEKYRLRLRRLSKLKVWAIDPQKDLDSLFKGNYRAIVVDLSKDDEQVRMITAARTLRVLWTEGEEKRKIFLKNGRGWDGTLVLIDEGHLFAPSRPESPQKALVSERIQRFADQGKKLNLYLMVITQQPGKLHPDVLAEFNNRIILRVNERRSLSVLEQTYGGLRGRYDGALTFELGEALIEGALLVDESPPPPMPRGVRFKMGRTREGGGTPKTDWALPKLRGK